MKQYYLESERTALFLIDMQDKLYPAIADKENLLKPLKILINLAKIFDMPIYITEQYPRGLGETLPEIKTWIENGDIHYWEKTAFNAYLPEVEAQIKKDEVKNFIVTGIEAHICVLQTVRELLNNQFNVFLVEDAVGSRDNQHKNNAVNLMREMGAVISNSESIAYDLLKDSKHPDFKTISNILKEN